MSRPSVIIVGAGALGAACVAAFARARWCVHLIDDQRPGAGSPIAAGMLAPAFESVLDGGDPASARMLTHARDLWPTFVQGTAISLRTEGARWIGGDAARVEAELIRLGFGAKRTPRWVETPDDWRLDPQHTLAQLSAQATRTTTAAAIRVAPGRVTTQSAKFAADLVVLATGVGRPIALRAEPALAAVTPIRGQIVHVAGAAPPCVLRAEGVYITPAAGGALIGATMEPGVTSLDPDAAATAALLEAAARVWPPAKRLDPAKAHARVGLRGATPDGLPLAGPVAPGLSVALAPRRNGWLLAPLVAQVAAAYAAGADPGPYAAALDPLRFQPS